MPGVMVAVNGRERGQKRTRVLRVRGGALVPAALYQYPSRPRHS